MFQTIGTAIYRRTVGETNPDQYDPPTWAWGVALVNLIVFLPLFIVINYTFWHVFPALAIVEDENPPAYEPVSLNDDDATSLAEQPISGSKPTRGNAHTVSSSFRATHRLLMANGGARAYLRGLACLMAQGALESILMGIFGAVVGEGATPIASLLASLTLVQYSTAWVHIVVSERSPLHFWRRLPAFKRTFEATWKPVALYWAATEVHRWTPMVLAPVLDLPFPKMDFDGPTDMPPVDASLAWKGLVIWVVSMLVSIFLVIPTQVVLVRVQASLLAPDANTIIPFDRSFEGRVEPAVVGGRGYATLSQAWATFSRAAWRRLIVLYIKIFAVTTAFTCLVLLVIIPQLIVIAKHSELKEGGDL